MIFKFPQNILVKISSNCVAIHDNFHSLKIFSKNETLENTIQGPFAHNEKGTIKIKGKYPDKKNRKKLIYNFLDCLINKNIKPIVTQKEQFDLMSICFAVDKSIKLNKTVKIKYF